MRSFFLIILLISSVAAFGQERTSTEGNGYRLEADKVYGQDNVSFTAEGNVIVTFRNSRLTADKATYYPDSETIVAEGSVTVSDDMQEINSDKVTYYLSSETGVLENSQGKIAGEYYICARTLTRVSREYYVADGLRVSTCSGIVPDWSFYFHRAEAEVEGYITGTHVSGNIKNFPILYTPKLFFPIKTIRQTGLMIPRLGYTTELGTYFADELFIALDYDKDMTVGAAYFAEKGLMGSLEGRYAIAPGSDIYVAADVIQDRESPMESDNRWRYASKSLVALPGNFEFLADAEMVSDFMFMRDFDSFSIYHNEERERNRENVFYQNFYLRRYGSWSDITLAYEDDMKYRDSATGYRKTSIKKEPSLTFEKSFIEAGPINVDYKLSWSNIAARDYNYSLGNTLSDDTLRYRRTDAVLDMYHAFDLHYLKLTPSLKMNYTRWDGFSDKPNVESDEAGMAFLNRSGGGYERFIPEFTVQATLNELFRYYGGDEVRGKHGIINTIEYSLTPGLEQTGLPDYFEDDIITEKNDLAWRIQSYLRYDKWTFNTSVRQAVSLNNEENKPLLPMEVDLYLGKQGVFSNTLEFEYDHYANKNPVGQQSKISLLDDTLYLYYKNMFMRGKYTYYRNIADYNTALEAELGVTYARLRASIGVIWRGRNDFLSLKNINPMESFARLTYFSDCWGLGLVYESEKYRHITSTSVEMNREHRISLFVSLKGLGESEFRFFKDESNY
jgi:LPS-assembly protein